MKHNQDDIHNAKLQISIQPNIGLDGDIRIQVVEMLNKTQSDEIILAQKTRNAYWNGSGTGFIELHILFDSQYKQMNAISDEIAERVRILGGIAIGSLREYIHGSRLEEQLGMVPNTLHLLADHETCIRFLREDVRKSTDEYEDEGTFELMVSIMRLHEKMAWMLRSYIENEPVHTESQIKI